MRFQLNKTYILLLLAAGVLNTFSAKSQDKDSLTLNTIIQEVVQNHPAVKKAMEELTQADAKIGIAQSTTLPNVDFATSYSRIGPVSTISIPDMGHFSFVPHDNYSAAFNVNQTIYDFGKTDRSIQLEKEAKELSRQSVEQIKQKLSQAAISNYFTLVYLQEALKIKDEQLKTLNEHLNYIKKKQQTGSATQYEILTTEVRISTIENQKTDIETARQIQMARLNSLLGMPESTQQAVKNELIVSLPAQTEQALTDAALHNRDEMKLASEKSKLAQLRYHLTDAQNNAVISGFFSGGLKNGYTPYLYDPKPNFVAGVGLKIPVFDGKRSRYNLQQAQSSIQMNDQETEITRRGIVNEVVESEAGVHASQKKVEQGQLQLKQATQAYTLAKVRYESGVITNVELLDGSTSVSESRLQLLKARIDYTLSLYNLKSAIGERLYQ